MGGKQYTSGTELHKVFAYNKAQCCNACVATSGCAAASFLTSDKDQSGGFGPQSWEGFGMHISGASASKTTGGISVSQLEGHFRDRFGDYSKFDQFMDYGVTFFTYDLQTYADAFKKDGIPFFVAEWEAAQTKDTWYSLFFLAKATLSTRQVGQFSQLAMRTGRSAVVQIPLWFDLVKVSLRMRAVAGIELSDAYSNISFDRRSVAAE